MEWGTEGLTRRGSGEGEATSTASTEEQGDLKLLLRPRSSVRAASPAHSGGAALNRSTSGLRSPQLVFSLVPLGMEPRAFTLNSTPTFFIFRVKTAPTVPRLCWNLLSSCLGLAVLGLQAPGYRSELLDQLQEATSGRSRT